MIFFSSNPKYWLISLAVSLGIFAVVYFAVIKPTTDTANKAITQGLHQSHQAIKAANQQFQNTSRSANQQLSNAQKLTKCLAQAGIDTSAISQCESQYGG